MFMIRFTALDLGRAKWDRANLEETLVGWILFKEPKICLTFLHWSMITPGLFSGPVLKNAIRRYEHLWLPLIAHQQRIHERTNLAAPLDIAWVWHVHMLAPHYYEKDCDNIVSGLVDHYPLTPRQRQAGLQRPKRVWEKRYPFEPFEVNLDNDPCSVPQPSTRIKYNLEEACKRQSKFYYQVSLPHYRDNRFLKDAVDRYVTHLRLKQNNPDMFLVPCYDFDLIWHAHQLHPTKYKQTTTKLLGRILKHDDSVTDRTSGSKLYDSTIKTRAIWKEAGCSLNKAGAMYRGDPPDPKTPHVKLLSVPLPEGTEYQVQIVKAEVTEFQTKHKSISIRLKDYSNTLVFSQGLKKSSKYSTPFIVSHGETGGVFEIAVALRLKRDHFGNELVNDKVNISKCLSAFQLGTGERSFHLNAGSYKVTVTIRVNFARFQDPSFTLEPCTFFTQFDHPLSVLSCPQLMLSSEDMAKPILPCESFTHSFIDSRRGNELFYCRVVHSNQGNNPLSVVEIVDPDGNAVSTSHLLSPTALPHAQAIEDQKTCVFLNDAWELSERAMLVRGRKDYGVCIGKWKEVEATDEGEPNCFVEIKFFNLQRKHGWCTFRKFKGGLYEVNLNIDSFVKVDLQKGEVIISPSICQDIPEILALAVSESILYLLCKPYFPKESREFLPCYHMHRQADRLSPMILAAGYYSTMVPTNTALMCRTPGRFHYSPNLNYASYDLDKEFGFETEDERNLIKHLEQLRKEEEKERREQRKEEERRRWREERERSGAGSVSSDDYAG